MSKDNPVSKDERTLAALAHASIILGLFTNGVGGLITALLIWLTQREDSDYVANQSLQALVYQAVVLLVTMTAWCCWGALWMAMIFVPLFADPAVYEAAPPAGLWVGRNTYRNAGRSRRPWWCAAGHWSNQPAGTGFGVPGDPRENAAGRSSQSSPAGFRPQPGTGAGRYD